MNGKQVYSPRSSTDQSGGGTLGTRSTKTDYDSERSNLGPMLSVDFSAPLAGDQRSERIKQMSKNHPSIERSRGIQEVLVNVQTSLRRMPGVSTGESKEINDQLKEAGQIISQDTNQLVRDLMSSSLELQENNQAVIRMSIESNLLKATVDQKDQEINHLRQQLAEAHERREETDVYVKQILDNLNSVTDEAKTLKETTQNCDPSHEGCEKLIKVTQQLEACLSPANEAQSPPQGLEETVKHLEDQVNNRRSLWVMKHPSPDSFARAIETLAEAVPEKDKDAIAKSFKSLRTKTSKENLLATSDPIPVASQEPQQKYRNLVAMSRAPSAFQPIERSSSVMPTKFSPLQAGPPRAPTANQHRSGAQTPWFHTNGGSLPRHANTPLASAPPAMGGGHRNGGGRRGSQLQLQNSYRAGAPEFYPTSIFSPAVSSSPKRPVTPLDDVNQDLCYPKYHLASPIRLTKGDEPRVFQDPFNANNANNNSALVSRNGRHTPSMIHMTERTVIEWSRQMSEFYSTIRTFVDKHAGCPVAHHPASLHDTAIWPVLLRTYLPLSQDEAQAYLDFHLRDGTSKLCLVTRVIVDYVVNIVWVASAWKGSEDESSRLLDNLIIDLAATQGQASSVRQPLLDRQASIICAIMDKQEPGSVFYKSKIEQIAGSLLTNLQPLLNEYTSAYDAFRDLVAVAENAWELSSRILISRLTFDFRFPEIGSRFSSQSMTPIWPVQVDPTELQAKHWRVALVTTPVITCRNDTGTNISAHSVAHADVICMQ
ncbi:unnamed protein product [Clonostachys chloroleuca]|uniref:Uncharacterized protein n=1 Tax=Clonostachys chloroleuca TaxID=1926264 RepID=A0AA35MIT4_9HYPO|nr:unnamed protein product [Clonostachys chloroleuca]